MAWDRHIKQIHLNLDIKTFNENVYDINQIRRFEKKFEDTNEAETMINRKIQQRNFSSQNTKVLNG